MIFRDNTVTMTKKELKAMLTFASEDATKPHVYGVLFKEEGIAVSTDSHRLVVHASDEAAERCNFKEKIVPRSALNSALKAAKRGDIEIQFDAKGQGRISVDGSSVKFQSVDAQFPPFMQVFPKVNEQTTQVPVLGFNASYLHDLAVIQDAAGEVACDFRPGEDLRDPMDVWVGTQWRAVVMPTRI